jgi:hypothetical protein
MDWEHHTETGARGAVNKLHLAVVRYRVVTYGICGKATLTLTLVGKENICGKPESLDLESVNINYFVLS